MNNPLIATYWKFVNALQESIPPVEDVIKFAYHIGRASNEVKKGVKSLKRKKDEKGKLNSAPQRIKIE